MVLKTITFKIIMLIFLLFFLINWTLEKDDSNIKIYSKPLINNLKAYKATSIINKNILDLSLFLLKINNHCQWVYNCLKSTKPKTFSTNHFYIYYQIDTPWPVQNREILSDTKFNIGIQNNQVFISIIMNVLKGEALNKNFYRVQEGKITLNLKEINYNQTYIEFIYEINPGSNIPETIVNPYNYYLTYNTIKNLKKYMEKKDL
ncbi:MAG: hypothetical protein KatS3mg129_1600 [Leptospiraceae bacterium]|nr:MAG: hypothetical protein KatS3mg129_1600 [Leptospiraceae bacterium]